MPGEQRKSKSGKLKLKKITAKDLKLGDKTAERLRGGRECQPTRAQCGPNAS